MTNRDGIIKHVINKMFVMDARELMNMFCEIYRGCDGCIFEDVNCPCGNTWAYTECWLKGECEVDA